jgi:mycobactin salicyl-AMP ligase
MPGKDANALICLPEPDLAYHGGVLIDIRELDRIYGDFPDFLDAAAFTIDDPVMGERIFAAVVPLPGAAPGEPEFRAYLESLEISPVKFPEKLVVVSVIPRDAQGRVLRGDILSQL